MTELNTYGFKPKGQRHFKLFYVDGFELLATLGPNEDEEGWGIRYSISLESDLVGPVSVWVGVTHEDGEEVSEEAANGFTNAFNDMDEEGARRALQVTLDQVCPIIIEMSEGGE